MAFRCKPFHFSFWVRLFPTSDIFLLLITCIFIQLYILSFALDEFCTTTTNYLLIFIIFENNPYPRPIFWIFFLISSGMNDRALNYDSHLVRKYLGNFTFDSSTFFHLLPHMLFFTFSHMESSFRCLMPSLEHIHLEFAYKSLFFYPSPSLMSFLLWDYSASTSFTTEWPTKWL